MPGKIIAPNTAFLFEKKATFLSKLSSSGPPRDAAKMRK
jgi:hypothetical protein